MSAEPIYIGVDAGGTTTRAAAVDSSGKLVATFNGDSINRNHHTVEQIRAVLEQMAGKLIPANGRVEAMLVGTSGISTTQDVEEVRTLIASVPPFGEASSLQVIHDSEVALLGAFGDGPGVILIAGTGVACLGRNEAGERYLCSAWGALVDDAGSAYWIATQALSAAARSFDGRGPKSSLEQAVLSFLNLSDAREMLDAVHNRGLTREHLAGLAPEVIAAGYAGDAVALGIVRHTIDELTLCVKTVKQRLFAAEAEVPVVLIGGVANAGGAFTSDLKQALAEAGAKVQAPRLPPEQAAALEALRRAHEVAIC